MQHQQLAEDTPQLVTLQHLFVAEAAVRHALAVTEEAGGDDPLAIELRSLLGRLRDLTSPVD